MSEKKWFLIEWKHGRANIISDFYSSKEEAFQEYAKTRDCLGTIKICETIYG